MPEIACDSIPQLKRSISETKSSPIVVNFNLPHAPQCTQITEVLKVLANQPANSAVNFIHVDANILDSSTKEFNVKSVPTVLIFRNGVEVDRMDSSSSELLTIPDFVKKITTLITTTKKESAPSDLNARLRELINQATVMLFMKGNPTTPRCGFSRKMVDLLNSMQISFDTFDILSDEEVRQGLKAYSDWPTYPQLYIKGDLVGGLDIVSELAQTGELKDMLQP